MPILGFFDNGYTISQGTLTATLAQPMTLTPDVSKRVDTYVFRDKTTTSVDVGKESDSLDITGLDFLVSTPSMFPFSFPITFGGTPTSMMAALNTMCDNGQPVTVANLAVVSGLDTGYNGDYYITRFSYTRKSGAIQKYYYELTLDSVT